MIIDSHVHLKHGNAEGTEYSPEAIVEAMDGARVDKSVVCAINTTTKCSIEMAQAAVDKFSDRLIPYANVEPSYGKTALDQIGKAVSRLGFRGMKIHFGYGVPEQETITPFLELAAAEDVPCLIDCVGRNEIIQQWAEAFPKTKLIVAHLGKYLCRNESLVDRFIALAAAHKNVLLDVNGVVLPRKIKEAVKRAGVCQVFFGTDGPHADPDLVGFVHTALDKIRSLDLPSDDEAVVLGRGIAKLLKL